VYRLRRMAPISLVLVVGLFVSLLMVPFQMAQFTLPGAEPPLAGSSVVEAQEVSSPWNRTFGGVANDGGRSVVEVSTGGFACAGDTMSTGAGQQDVWLVRTTADGSPQWSQTYGGADSDWGKSVLEASGGGFAIAGYTETFGAGGYDVWVLWTSADGNLLWNRTYGGLLADLGYSMVEVSTGGFAITGSTENFGASSSDMWLIRTDTGGNILWNHTYGGSSLEAGLSMIEVSTGGFAITGWTTSFGAGGADILLVRMDANGNLLWSRTYGGPNDEYGHSVIEVSTGGFAITGDTNSFGAGSSDVWLLRTNTNGNLLWNRTYGGFAGDRGRSLQEVSGGGFAITGDTASFGAGNYDAWYLQTDSDGNLLWNQTYGGTEIDWCFSMVGVSTGGFAILGGSYSFGAGMEDFWLIHVNAPGLMPTLPPELLFLLMGVLSIIVIIVVIVLILRRRRGRKRKRRRKS
jgi:hypothetical protein